MNSNYGNSGIRKTHYDSKESIALEFTNDSHESATAFSVGKAFDDDMSIGMESESAYTDAFEMDNEAIFEDVDDFAAELSGGAFAMAKAYDENEDDDFDVYVPPVSHANAMSEDQPSLPIDKNNQYSDVFESADDDIFEDVPKPQANAPQVEAMADEVEVDDQFAKDLHAVLSGQKSLANLAEYSEGQQTTPVQNKPPQDDTDKRVKDLEEKMANDEAIFDQLAADRNNLTTYQLGEVELKSIFDEADDGLLKGSVALAKDRVEDIIDEQSMAMDGMEYAEDFELMESIAEEDLAESKTTTPTVEDNPDIKDAVIEEEIVVSPEDNTVSGE